ncbi:MAG: serine/threonine-protein kinase [Kofleriaceae bacterium]|nr:serine/threonine-protein kinase [Kofleriaceae bacterium]
MVARQRLFGGASTEEEARVNLQSRLNLYCKVMFWSFITLIAFLWFTYNFVLANPPEQRDVVLGGSAVMLGVMALLWRLIVPRRTITIEGLYRLDLLFAVAIGSTFGASAALQHELQAASYTSLLFGAFNVFTRALVVPSSARRTAIVSTLTFLPILAGGLRMAIFDETELGGTVLIGGGITFAAIAVVIATNGSAIIYGLRRQVSEVRQLGVYKLDRKIGAGGMGEVWHAQHALLRRPTAVKFLLPDRLSAEELDRFEGEVQHMSQLTHPNTVAVFDYGRNIDGLLYYAMEYLDGIDLQQLVTRYGVLPAGRVVHILSQVCGALQEAHDQDLIHQDIKPANIILCERGGMFDVAKVVDFGLAENLSSTSSPSERAIRGTPAYIAPEAVADPDRIGPASDLYALGAVGYFLLTGRLVFIADSQQEMLMMHVTSKPRPLNEVAPTPVPRELEAAIMKCLEKAPSQRFASARELADALAAMPADPSWSPAQATLWWRDFRSAKHAPPPSEVETLTITVDLGARAS